MSDLEALLNDLANLEAQADLDGLRQARQQIVDQHPDSDQAAEAQYKIGLDLLFRNRDIPAAIECFKAAIKKKHPYWSPAARISMALCLYRQGSAQKAIFELRKSAFPEDPTPNSITALTFIELIFDETGKKEEAQRARKDRISQLKRILKLIAADEPQSRAHFLHQLGMEYQRDANHDKAEALFQEALDFGEEAIGTELFTAISASM